MQNNFRLNKIHILGSWQKNKSAAQIKKVVFNKNIIQIKTDTKELYLNPNDLIIDVY